MKNSFDRKFRNVKTAAIKMSKRKEIDWPIKILQSLVYSIAKLWTNFKVKFILQKSEKTPVQVAKICIFSRVKKI